MFNSLVRVYKFFELFKYLLFSKLHEKKFYLSTLP